MFENSLLQQLSFFVREISGVRTTIPFCEFTLNHPAFREGDFDTHFVPDHFSGLTPPEENEFTLAAIIGPLIKSDEAGSPQQNANAYSNSQTHANADERTTWWVKRRV